MIPNPNPIYTPQSIDNLTNDEKYVLAFIEGRFGSGKTLYLTRYAVMHWQEYNKVYSNYNIKVDNGVYLPYLSKETILACEKNSLLCLQEAYNYFDRRYCMRKKNKHIMEAIFQIRKRNIHILADIPALIYLDFRCIDRATRFLSALGEVYEYSPLGVKLKGTGIYNYSVNKLNLVGTGNLFPQVQPFMLDMMPFYPYYNHEEITNEDGEERKMPKSRKSELEESLG